MLKETLTENLFKMGDFLEIMPLDGRRRTFKVNRTLLKMSLIVGAQERIERNQCILRGMKGRGCFILERTFFFGEEAFRLKAVDDLAFLHNGNVVYESLIRRGDLVEIEHYKFQFLGERGQERDPHNALSSIVSWPKDSFVCLEGETGTGKTSLARELHNKFCGESLPFVAINLSAFNENLIESEIFGHEKGAFTGAFKEKRGAIELARGGTLFIDELDSLPIYLQVKILTFLDDMKFRRVGGEQEKVGQCRLIFSSGRALLSLVKKGDFRQDLYYRVSSGLNIRLQPIREKKEVIKQVIHEHEETFGVTFHPSLVKYLLNYPWPGNFRELKSHLNRKITLSHGQALIKLGQEEELLDQDNLHFYTNKEEDILTLEKLRENYCQQVFLKSNGSYVLACKRLGISKSTLKRVLANQPAIME